MLLGSIKDLITYNPNTGQFYNLVDRNSRSRKGDILGSVSKYNGYTVLRFNNKIYRAHRLAWFFMTGSFPENDLDHINGDRSDNRFSNLREATRKENTRNTKYRGGASGYKGVFPSGKNWRARITVDGKQINLGTFKNISDAVNSYDLAAKLYFGDFAKVNFKEEV